MKTYVHLWYLAELSLEWEMFLPPDVEKLKTHITTFFQKHASNERVRKNMVEQVSTDDNPVHVCCMLTN
jgi:hypothetical protein